ncbi:MAG: helix-turn-helix domain-containing protein [Desulfitobacteriia bacterium]|jgi:AraC-like DNA-binding protein
MRPKAIQYAQDLPVEAFVRNISSYPYHWHKAVEIIYVMEGSVFVCLGNKTHLLKEHNLAVINSDEPHFIRKNSETHKLLILLIDADFCARVIPDYQHAFIYCRSPQQESKAPEKYRVLKEQITRLVVHLNNKSESPKNHDKYYKNSKKYNKEQGVKDCLKEMLVYLLDNFDYMRFGSGTVPFDQKQAKRIKKIAEHIQNRPSEKIGLKELAEEVGVTLSHLSHDIKGKFGLSFREIMDYRRGMQAVKMLIGTDKAIAEISSECGFSDPKYLIKYFKKAYHCTPSHFRKTYRADGNTLALQVQYEEYPLAEALRYLSVNQPEYHPLE